MTKTKTLYFDESGNTGPNLLDPQQKFFSVGSTDLTEAEAATLLQKHFGRHVGKDIKFKKLFRDCNNYDDLIDFAKTVASQPKRFFCFLMDKKFALLARAVDWLVEPLFHDLGYDWYKDDYGLSWVNLFHFAFKTAKDGEPLLDEVTGLYATLIREPSPDNLRKLRRRYHEIAAGKDRNIGRFMEYMAAGADAFEASYSLDDIKNHTDLHVTSLVSSVGWWRSQHAEDFEIVHDESTYFFKRQGIWNMITSMSASDAVVRVAHKSITFPLRVRSTREGKSERHSSLQIADLIGGFVARAKSDRLTDEQQAVIGAMVDAGMGEIGFDCVTPGDSYAKGMPPLADGPDAVDQVALATRKRSA